MDAQFLTKDLHDVMEMDALLSSHPIVMDTHEHTPGQISDLFDKIIYSKGASVLRMLERFMGHEKFKEGIWNYLKNYQFPGAHLSFEPPETDDLWTCMETVSGQNIRRVMNDWTLQMGYPILILKEVYIYII